MLVSPCSATLSTPFTCRAGDRRPAVLRRRGKTARWCCRRPLARLGGWLHPVMTAASVTGTASSRRRVPLVIICGRSWRRVIAGCLLAKDGPRGCPGGGYDNAKLDRDLEGAGFDGDLGGLASVRQADLDPLAADHDRPADGYPPPGLQVRAVVAAGRFRRVLRAARRGPARGWGRQRCGPRCRRTGRGRPGRPAAG